MRAYFSPNLFVFNSFGLCYNEGREKRNRDGNILGEVHRKDRGRMVRE